MFEQVTVLRPVDVEEPVALHAPSTALELACRARHNLVCSSEVAGGQGRERERVLKRNVGRLCRDVRDVAGGHLVEQPRDCLRTGVTSHGPRRVRVAETQAKVGHIREELTAIEVVLREFDLFTVDNEIATAKKLHVEAGGAHDDIGFELLSVLKLDAITHNLLNLPGGDVGVAVT